MLTPSRLIAFDASDKSRRIREEALNTLEAFTYRARDYLEDESFISSSTKEIRSSLEEKLSAASDWIYSEGHAATETVLGSKLKELKDLVEPVLKRKDESNSRPAAIKELQSAIDDMKTLIPMVKEQIASASKAAAEASKSSASSSSSTTASASTDPLDELEDEDMLKSSASESAEPPIPTALPPIYSEEDVKFLEEALEKSTKWLDEKQAAQKKLKESDDAAFSIKELKDQAKKLNDAVTEMMTRKFNAINNQQKKAKAKPKTKKAPKKSKKTKAGKKEAPAKEEQPRQEPTEEELREALEKAGLKGDGIKLENLGVKDEMKNKDGKPLRKLDLGDDATEEDILAAIDRATQEAKDELEKEKKHDEL